MSENRKARKCKVSTTSTVLNRLINNCFFFFFANCYFPASGQAVVTGVIPSPPRFLPPIFITHRVQQSHCSSIVHRMLLTHALALSASQFVHKEKSQQIYTSTHSAGLELTKLTYTRFEDNLIRHRGDRLIVLQVDPPTVDLIYTIAYAYPLYDLPGTGHCCYRCYMPFARIAGYVSYVSSTALSVRPLSPYGSPNLDTSQSLCLGGPVPRWSSG